MDVGAAVAALALHPLRELPPTPGMERIEREGILVGFAPGPVAPRVEPLDLEAVDVPAAVAVARAAARERGKRFLAWWIAPEHDLLRLALEAEGLVNRDTTGLEAIENAMALVQAPTGGSPQIAVSAVESYEDFTAAVSVLADAFEVPEAMRVEARALRPRRWEEYRRPENPMRRYVARIGDEIVGTAGATFGDAGVNLSAAAVLAHARGRGVYRALTAARWEDAVRRGTPALTVQAGRMSTPILTRLGFTPVGEVRVYVDDLERPATDP
jgi:GNAT superfamily N-acetyltransferase